MHSWMAVNEREWERVRRRLWIKHQLHSLLFAHSVINVFTRNMPNKLWRRRQDEKKSTDIVELEKFGLVFIEGEFICARQIHGRFRLLLILAVVFFVFICSDYTLSFRTQIHWEVEGIGCFWILFLARIPSVWCFLVFEALPWQKVALVVSGIGMLLTSPGASLVNGASSVCLHRFIFVQPIGWRFFSYLFALDKA